MSSKPGTPINDEPRAVVSVAPIPSDPVAQFPSETDIGSPTGASRMPDELQLLAAEDIAAPPANTDRSRSFVWPLVNAATAVTAIAVGASIGWLMSDNAAPTGERLAPRAATLAEMTPLPSAPIVAYGATAVAPVIARSARPTHVPSEGRNNAGRRAWHVVKSARAVAVSAHRRSSDTHVQIPAAVVPIERAAVFSAAVPTAPRENPAIPSLLAPTEVRVTATASDPDRDALTYQWSASVGRFANALERETLYTCPDSPTTVALTVTVTDGRGGVASDQLTIYCVERP